MSATTDIHIRRNSQFSFLAGPLKLLLLPFNWKLNGFWNGRLYFYWPITIFLLTSNLKKAAATIKMLPLLSFRNSKSNNIVKRLLTTSWIMFRSSYVCTFWIACHFLGFPVVRPSLFNLLSPKTLELNLFVLNKQMNGLCWKSKQSCALLDKEFVKSLLSCSSWMLLRLFFSSLNVSKGKLEGFVVHPTSVTSLTHIFYQILGIGRDRNFQKGCSVAN